MLSPRPAAVDLAQPPVAGEVEVRRILWPTREEWALAWRHLEVAAVHSDGRMTPESVQESLLEDGSYLWLVRKAGEVVGAALTERRQDGAEGWVNLVALQLDPVGALGAALEAIRYCAAADGCRLCGYSQRPGMGRLLARHGWRPRFVEYVYG